MAKSGSPRRESLSALIYAAEYLAGQDSVSSILLLDNEGKLRNASSPRLPEDYLAAIDGLRPDPEVGTCAAAAATGDVVLTPDFKADEKWAELRHLPMELGFAGAWSMPIKDANGTVLGTFGTYYRDHRKPTVEEFEGIRILAQAAAEVITGSV